MDTLEWICYLLADLGRREDFLSYSARLIMAAGNDETINKEYKPLKELLELASMIKDAPMPYFRIRLEADVSGESACLFAREYNQPDKFFEDIRLITEYLKGE